MQSLHKDSRFQIVSLKNLLKKANEKLSTQRAPKTTLETPPFHPPRVPSQNHWPRNNLSFIINWSTGGKNCP